MEPILKFSISNQRIYREDNFHVVAGSKNYLTASFEFKTPEWQGKTKTAVFHADKPYSVILVNGTCEVPWEFTAEPGSKYVSVFAGDLITANKAKVEVWESGYKEGETPEPPTPSAYEQIMTLLESKADGMSYSGNILKLLSGENELARVTITGGGGAGREIELQKGETAIQWRYSGDTEWIDLVLLADITGPAGVDGQDGREGQPGADGITPHIGENGNWYLGDTDTGKPSRGETGPAGQDGAQGPKGDTGADGKSAYQYAKEGGYTGTEDEFKAKLAKEVPESLPNPHALTFTGAVTGTYDGSEAVALDIPNNEDKSRDIQLLIEKTFTEEELTDVLKITLTSDEYPELLNIKKGVAFIIGDASATSVTWIKIRLNGVLIGEFSSGAFKTRVAIADFSNGRMIRYNYTNTNQNTIGQIYPSYLIYNYNLLSENPPGLDGGMVSVEIETSSAPILPANSVLRVYSI